jgi:hypothetical protein
VESVDINLPMPTLPTGPATNLALSPAGTHSKPGRAKKIKFVRDAERFPWAFGVKDVRYFFDKPVVIDAALRSRLDAFRGRDPNKAWAWLVQGTKVVTAHDFRVLIGRAEA